MINLVTVFPKALNLNGDQGNLHVLRDFYARCGLESKIIAVETADQLQRSNPDFVFVGHGSAAAHASIDEQLIEMKGFLTRLNCPVMFVASGVEFAIEKLHLGIEQIKRGERESLFSVGQLEELKVLGYRNTDSGLPDIWMEGNVLFSMLHGPVLAKNPALLQNLVNRIHPAVPLEREREWFEKVNEICRRVWELETEVEFPKLAV